MSYHLYLDLIIPGVIAFQIPATPSATHLDETPVRWTQEAGEISELVREADKISVAIEEHSWITKSIVVPAQFSAHRRDVGIFEMGASLSAHPDEFYFAPYASPSNRVGQAQLISAIRHTRVQHLVSSLIPADRLDHLQLVPRGVALATGWMESQRAPRPSLLATVHHGIGSVALINNGELLINASLRVRAPRADQFATAAGLELATMIANWKGSKSTPSPVMEALHDLGRVVCFGDLDSDLVRSEFASRMNIVVESGSSAIIPPIPVPMRLRDSWCVALGMRVATDEPIMNTASITIREVNL